MKLLPLLVHTLRFVLRCGGKLDLTPGEVNDMKSSKYSQVKLKVCIRVSIKCFLFISQV